MIQIAFWLLLGIAIGALRLIPDRMQRLVNFTSTLCLLVMLTALGAKLGAEPGILGRIGFMGIKALILAVAAIAGAVVGVLFLQRTTIPQKQKQTSNKDISA